MKMRRVIILTVLLYSLFIGAYPAINDNNFAGGNGTINDPYRIETAEHLNNVRYHLDAYFEQTANINLQGNEWNPIGFVDGSNLEDSAIFTGKYDGRGYTISNLHINKKNTVGVGFFAFVGKEGEVTNLGLKDITVEGLWVVGGLVGWNRGTITNCHVDGNIYGKYLEEDGEKLYGDEVGGLVGYNGSEGTISNSFATGKISGNEWAGGLVGWNYKGTISHSFAACEVLGEQKVGGLAGVNNRGSINNSFYDEEVSGQSDTGKGEPKTTAEMKQQATYTGWDFIDTWDIDENESYPYLRWQKVQAHFEANPEHNFVPFDVQFSDESEGNITNWHWDFGDGNTSYERNPKHKYNTDGIYPVTLTVTGTVNNKDSFTRNIVAIEFTGGKGDSQEPFTIDSANAMYYVRFHEDKHFKQTRDIDMASFHQGSWIPIGDKSVPFKGFFDGNGYKIMGLTIDNPDTDYIGLFGYVEDGAELSNIFLEDTDITGKSYTGSLAGLNKGKITGCYAAGIITGSNSIGGLTGENNGEVTDSFYIGKVLGEDNVGGLTGVNHGEIVSGFTMSTVTGNNNVGGLVGHNQDTASISHCYSAGAVSGTNDTGGLIGKNEGNVNSSYYDENMSGQTDTGKGEPKTTAEMLQQATYDSWDFVETWDIEENERYPYLRWQPWHMTWHDDFAIVESYEFPPEIYRKRNETITLTFRNTGHQAWEKVSTIKLQALGDHDDLAAPEFWSVALENDVLPAQLHTFTIDIYPPEAGTFTTEWQMIKEGALFGEKFSKDVEVIIHYTNVQKALWQLFE